MDLPNPDRPRGLFVGFCAGLLVMTFGLTAGFAVWGMNGAAGLALLIATFSVPFWAVGAFILGGPIWVLAEYCGLRGPWAAALLGAAIIGGIWLVCLSGTIDGDGWLWALAASSIGAVSGAAAGAATWWGGYRWGQPK